MPGKPRPLICLFRVAFVVALLGLALAVRLHELGRESFWYDEAFTAMASDNSISEVLADNAADVHPPLFYLGVYFWRSIFGDSDAHIRSYSAM